MNLNTKTALVAAQLSGASRCERVQSGEEQDSAGADLEAQAQLVVLLVQGKEVEQILVTDLTSDFTKRRSPKGLHF